MTSIATATGIGGKSTAAPPVAASATMEAAAITPWVLDFGVKTVEEVEIDGKLGLLLKGYASKFNEIDLSGEYQATTAFHDITDAWGGEAEPVIWWQHGRDAVLGCSRVGKAVKHEVDDQGLYVESFVPKDPAFKSEAKRRRFAEIYAGIKAGAIRGYSVGGSFIRVGRALAQWSMSELSITDNPCLPSAVFSVGSKALSSVVGTVPMPTIGGKDDDAAGVVDADDGLESQSVLGVIPRSAWSDTMAQAQQNNDRGLHDHLLARPPEYQGKHDSEQCPLCVSSRAMYGVKDLMTLEVLEPEGVLVLEDQSSSANSISREQWTEFMKAAQAALDFSLHGCLMGRSPQYQGAHDGNACPVCALERRAMGIKANRNASTTARGAAPGGTARERVESADGTKTGTAGAKAFLAAHPDLRERLRAALPILLEMDRGTKAGRTHSKATLDAVLGVIALLRDTFGLTNEQIAQVASAD